MSLLLDALKKAAVDKEMSSKASGVEKTQFKARTVSPQSESSLTKRSHLQPVISKQSPVGEMPDDVTDNAEILTLDFETEETDELSLSDESSASEPAKKQEESSQPLSTNESPDKTVDSSRDARSAASKLTISDDALSLLIDKTNRDEKLRKITVTVSVILVSLIVVFSGGLYYYYDMQEEIAAINQKHLIAMQQMHAKTSREKTPEKTAIISNLVSDAKLEEKVEYAKSQIAVENLSHKKQTDQKQAKSKVTASDLRSSNANSVISSTNKHATDSASNDKTDTDLSIQRNRKSDPVGEKLDAAWLAYENKQYSEAKQLYRDVLKIEDSNRDAQLGLGAIAIIEKDLTRARRIYSALLQLDPRDPIVTSALAGINSNESTLKPDGDHLLSLLEKNPDSPVLNFSVGNNYAQQNKWESAQRYYFKAWQQDSENADYLFNLAVSMDQLGKPSQALNFYRDSLEKSSNKQVSFSVAAVQKRIKELSGL